MSEERAYALWVDLVKIVRRHGVDACIELAAMLRDPAVASALAESLQGAAEAAKRHKLVATPSRSSARWPGDWLKEITAASPDRASAIGEILSVDSGRAPSLATLRRVGRLLPGSPAISSASRSELEHHLQTALSSMPAQDLRELRDRLMRDYVSVPDQLAVLSAAILGRPGPGSQEPGETGGTGGIRPTRPKEPPR